MVKVILRQAAVVSANGNISLEVRYDNKIAVRQGFSPCKMTLDALISM